MTNSYPAQEYERLQKKYPHSGDTVIFAKLIKNKGYSRKKIEMLFNRLVVEKLTKQTKEELFEFHTTL